MGRWAATMGSCLAAGALVASSTVVALTAGPAPVATAQTSFTFSGGGWGHGVGMSQYGAKGRADAGQTTSQILDAYYPGAAVETRSLAGPRVKIGDANVTEVWADGGPIYGTAVGGSPVVLASPGEHLAIRTFSSALNYQVVAPTTSNLTLLAAPNAPFTLSWDPGGKLSVSSTGRSYSDGALRLIPTGSGTFEMVLVDMTMQQYLYGLGEMPTSWAAEALKTQAIAGRSYAAYRLAHPQDSQFDMYASVSDQAYIGSSQTASATGGNWMAAVNATDGQVLTSGGVAIQAFYSSSNGGFTERSDYVFAATLPYLVASSDPYDQATGNPNFSWSRTYTGDELAAWFNAAGRGNVGSVTGVTIGGNVGASGRIDKATITVVGTTKTVTMTGNQFRSAINAGAVSARDLLSTKLAAGVPTTTVAPPPPAPVAAPADTTAPDLKVLVGNPMRFGATGNICAFLLSNETAITAIHIRLGNTDLRSAVGGVGPSNPLMICINIPPRLRPKRATHVVLTGAALDVAVNMRFVQQTVTIQR